MEKQIKYKSYKKNTFKGIRNLKNKNKNKKSDSDSSTSNTTDQMKEALADDNPKYQGFLKQNFNDQSMMQQPMMQQPMIQHPMMQQPMMQQPMMQQPMMQQPMIDQSNFNIPYAMQQPMMDQSNFNTPYAMQQPNFNDPYSLQYKGLSQSQSMMNAEPLKEYKHPIESQIIQQNDISSYNHINPVTKSNNNTAFNIKNLTQLNTIPMI
jgi:hypothetical protein